jgi:AraC-like DNA-binding protein
MRAHKHENGGTGERADIVENSFRHLSTRGLPAAHRFEFWRNIHTFIDVDVSGQDARKNFRADLLLHIADDGATFGRATSDDVVSRFARSCDEYVMFSMSLSGTANITTHSDARRTVNPLSGLAVIDGGRPMTTVTEGLSHVYLTVPTARIGNILTSKAGLLRDGFCEIPQDGLAGLLMSHLVWMARNGERLDKPSTEVAMKTAVDLAVGTLAHMPDGLDPARDGSLDQAYHAAACRYIQLHLGHPNLTAEEIAHAVGCSRAQLFRVFARHEQAVGDVIRAERFARASALLASPSALPIEQVALACGFASPSAFTRAFRDWSGATPSAFREQMRLGGSPQQETSVSQA